MTSNLLVGLSAWIIQDGNYGDFARGDQAAFALEFYASDELTRFESERSSIPSLTHVDGPSYKASARVVHVASDWWAMDVGVMVFCDAAPPRNANVGSWLRGDISIGIDPFFYFERLATEPCAPALIFDWRIEKIERQTAPLIEIQPRVMARDREQLGWIEIEKTDAWNDDEGRADYVLHCRRLDGPARRTLTPLG